MTTYYQTQANVLSNDEIARNIYELKLHAPEIAAMHQPGHFINILPNPEGAPLWRRPFSIARIEEKHIIIIYKAIGIGTHQMAVLQHGDTADILGPLGNTFTLNISEKTIPLIIGGGLGLAPLISLRDHFVNQGIRPVIFAGAMTRTEHYYTEDQESEIRLTTDDGTLGLRGFVTDSLLDFLESYDPGQDLFAYSCGPEPMMSKVASICSERNIPLELSIEREMACGIGLCQGCAIEQNPPHKKYALVCKDGPVFNAKALSFAGEKVVADE